MIPIETSWFVFLYLFLFLSAIFLTWIGFEMRCRRPSQETPSGLLTCRQCGMVFAQSKRKNFRICPRCGAAHASLHDKNFK